MTSSVQRARGTSQEPDRNLTVDQFARELDADTVTLIGIREPDEAGRTGAIPGAVPSRSATATEAALAASTSASTAGSQSRSPVIMDLPVITRAQARRPPSVSTPLPGLCPPRGPRRFGG